MLDMENIYTSTYILQSNGQVKRHNRTLVAMLRNYVNDHQDDWEKFASALAYTYNCHVNCSTAIRPFDLLLSRPRPDFTLYQSVVDCSRSNRESRDKFFRREEETIGTALNALQRNLERY